MRVCLKLLFAAVVLVGGVGLLVLVGTGMLLAVALERRPAR